MNTPNMRIAQLFQNTSYYEQKKYPEYQRLTISLKSDF